MTVRREKLPCLDTSATEQPHSLKLLFTSRQAGSGDVAHALPGMFASSSIPSRSPSNPAKYVLSLRLSYLTKRQAAEYMGLSMATGQPLPAVAGHNASVCDSRSQGLHGAPGCGVDALDHGLDLCAGAQLPELRGGAIAGPSRERQQRRLPLHRFHQLRRMRSNALHGACGVML